MKILNKFLLAGNQRINYKEAWFDGKVRVLSERDFGPGDNLRSKLNSIRAYAKDHYKLSLRATILPDGTIVIQAKPKPKRKRTAKAVNKKSSINRE